MSTLTVTTINTGSGTTDLTMASGNTSAGKFVVQSGGGLTLASNSSTNAINITSTGNVGIGTSTSSLRLSSNGGIRSLSTTGTGYININHDGTNGSLVSNTGNFLFYAEGVNGIYFHTNGSQRGIFDGSGNFQFNSGYGSVATAYGCRAWISFDPSSGTPSVRGSGNITSITDNGAGDYTLNLTNAMPDVNYTTVFGFRATVGSVFSIVGIDQSNAPTTSAVRVAAYNTAGTRLDNTVQFNVAIFR